MVFVEERSNYLHNENKGKNFLLLRDFLINNCVETPNREGDIFHKLLFSLFSNDTETAQQIVQDYSAKEPNQHSQYIYKDMLIFLFICTTKKFDLNQDWINKFLRERKGSQEEKKSITKTFENIVENNFQSKNNLYEIILVYKDILGTREKNQTILNETYSKLSKREFPFYESDFLNIVSIKAIDLIILWKEVEDYEENIEIKQFAKAYDNRVKSISYYFSWGLVASLFVATCYFSYVLLFGSTKESEFSNKIFTILGFVGLSLTGIGRTKIESYIKSGLNLIFGRN